MAKSTTLNGRLLYCLTQTEYVFTAPGSRHQAKENLLIDKTMQVILYI